MKSKKIKIAGMTLGGPCPGVNAAMAGAALLAMPRNSDIYLIPRAFEEIMLGRVSRFQKLTPELIHLVRPRGGTHAGTSKAYPPKNPECLENSARILVENFDGLVATGGDGSVTILAALNEYISRHCQRLGKTFPMVMIPKSVDDDAALPPGVRMLGASTMAEATGRRIEALRTDCWATRDRWQIAVVMGRRRGHLALSAAIHGLPHVLIIGEQFPKGAKLSEIADILCAAFVKRAALGDPHGVAVIAEGLVQELDPKSHESLATLPLDENGALNPSVFPFDPMIRASLDRVFAEIGFKTSIRISANNYDLRGESPNGFDQRLGTELGAQAVLHVLAGEGDIVIYKLGAEILSLPFSEFLPKNGEGTLDRPVDCKSDEYRIARALGSHLNSDDLQKGGPIQKMASLCENLDQTAFRNRFRNAALWGDQ